MASGIYEIVNLTNRKKYLGQTTDLNRRRHEHWSRAKAGMETPLYNDMRSIGFSHFMFNVIEECPVEQLRQKEKWYIEYFKPFYNVQ